MEMCSSGSIWTATFNAMASSSRRSSADRPKTPPTLVQPQPYPLSLSPRRQSRAAVQQGRLGQSLQGAGQRALAFAGGGEVEPRPVVGGVEQGAAQGRA